MSEEKLVKVTVEYDGKTHEFEGYTFLGSMIAFTKDAPAQFVMDISFGRISTGDRLSAVVASITRAKNDMSNHPADVRGEILTHAILEGLNGGL